MPDDHFKKLLYFIFQIVNIHTSALFWYTSGIYKDTAVTIYKLTSFYLK